MDRSLELLPLFRLSDSAEEGAVSYTPGPPAAAGCRWRVLPAPNDRLPGTFDQDVYVELLHRFHEAGRPADGTIAFTLHAFLRTMGRRVDGRTYEQLRGALTRLERTVLESTGAYFVAGQSPGAGHEAPEHRAAIGGADASLVSPRNSPSVGSRTAAGSAPSTNDPGRNPPSVGSQAPGADPPSTYTPGSRIPGSISGTGPLGGEPPDRVVGQYVDERFTVLSAVIIERRRSMDRDQLGLFPALTSHEPGEARVVLAPLIRANIAAGWTVPISTAHYFELPSPMARRLYRLLSAVRAHASASRALRTLPVTWDVALEALAEQLPLSQRYPSHLQRVLEPAHTMLKAAGLVGEATIRQHRRAWVVHYELL